MDRRSFSPSPEGLEGRKLLSLFGGATTKQNTTISIQDLPKTYKQKEIRIAHLPFYLLQEDYRRDLPGPVVTQLQNDLNSIVGSLSPPPPPIVNAFNAELRILFPQNTLSKANAERINNAFGSVLAHAGTPPEVASSLQNDMLALSKVDALSIQPSSLAREDYAVVLQTTLAVGRPLLTPYAPALQAKDGVKILGGKAGLTHDNNPTIVGSYPGGASIDGAIWMQIVDQSGQVVGTAPVTPAGTYTVKITTELPNGNYDLRARSSDEVGHLSILSKPFILGVKTFIPRRDRVHAQPATTTVVQTTTTADAATPASDHPLARHARTTTVVSTTNPSTPGGPLALGGGGD